MQKIFYEVDPFNRLIIKSDGKRGGLKKFRRTLEGRFKVGESNTLSYIIRAPLSEDERIPHKVKLDGSWSLGNDHELRFTLDKEGRRTFGDQIMIRGQIIGSDKNSLSFSVVTTVGNKLSTYLMSLDGSWSSDDKNRLCFSVLKEGGKTDVLTFNGAWDINKDHQIAYEYKKPGRGNAQRGVHSFVLKGRWDVSGKTRLSYILEGDTTPALRFNVSAGIAAANYIKYEAGISIAGKFSPIKRSIMLYGRWRLKRHTGLIFEIRYSGGKTGTIVFGADIALLGDDMVSFKLKNSFDNKDLGMELEISKKILGGDGQVFLRALASKPETACYAGAAWRW